MPNFIFKPEHISHIRTVIAEKNADDKVKVWENSLLSPLRRELKHYILSNRTDGIKCAYCLKNFYNEHSMNIDVEHILPKSQYPEYTFTLKNLAVACKRCNLLIKRNDVSFLNDNFNRKKPFNSKYYAITHPVIDRKNNLYLLDVHFNGCHIIKYQAKSVKAENTYNYFKLNEVEIEALNSAQGINQIVDLLNTFNP
ncbi:HNH endonuclease [Klebsiella quasipneumoniae]|uniref:HNH endonuclease n=1 Tax=Klebsiella quasipneumoniae TaxID=1463165 RepID=UPI002405297D|nr:HNH endonuclease [Klebsiella quasipneumoniae]MDG0509479.1 HNH endonuclease [Klebsiella quasipneumoniae]MDG0522848.1 HNH endonuclease [Klebsiella quasipneumoniae]